MLAKYNGENIRLKKIKEMRTVQNMIHIMKIIVER